MINKTIRLYKHELNQIKLEKILIFTTNLIIDGTHNNYGLPVLIINNYINNDKILFY